MTFKSGNFQRTVVAICISAAICFLLAPFFGASCRTQRRDERAAIDQLRAMTRNGVFPADTVLIAFEKDYPDSRVAGLARIVRARARMKANDFAGASDLLNWSVIYKRTGIGDYALFMRARAEEQAGQAIQARADFEKVARDYPQSLRVRDATLEDASILLTSGQAAAIPGILSRLNDATDPKALLTSGKAWESTHDATRALGAYRRIYFFAPASPEATEAAAALPRLGSSTSPASVDEASARANGLFKAKRYQEAAIAWQDAFSRFPATATPENQLKRGVAASDARMTVDAVNSLSGIPVSSGESRAEALYYLAQTYAAARQWPQVHSTLDEMRKAFPQSGWTPRAYVNAGNIAQTAKNTTESALLYKQAIAAYPGTVEVAQAQFDAAWLLHLAKNYQQSSRQLIEHLAMYADKNNDNRGRAGYWAARDSERAGNVSAAKVLYQAMQSRYDANWYGFLSSQRLAALKQTPAGRSPLDTDQMLAKAVANLKTVSVANGSKSGAYEPQLAKAADLNIVGEDDWALEELSHAAGDDISNPYLNLAQAKIYRSREDNVQAFNVLKRSYPDYSQMKPEELSRDEWDVFYPLAYWGFIKDSARARNLDPHQVAGLIRQESVFNPRARSGANAYGLMQLLLPTARVTAQRYGENSSLSVDSLYDPRTNIALGTGYLRDQLDKFGRIEYVAAAYNAGPGRVVQWRNSLPPELDEWVEAIPFRETRNYVQGVVRNTLQYARLYDENGNFLSTVGSSAVNGADSSSPQTSDPTVIRRPVAASDEE